jgi:hypothetical protein
VARCEQAIRPRNAPPIGWIEGAGMASSEIGRDMEDGHFAFDCEGPRHTERCFVRHALADRTVTNSEWARLYRRWRL